MSNSSRPTSDERVPHKLIFYSLNLQHIDRTAKTVPENRLGTTFSVTDGVGGSGVGDLPDGWWQSYAGGAQGKAGGGTRRRSQQKAFAVLFDLGLGQ